MANSLGKAFEIMLVIALAIGGLILIGIYIGVTGLKIYFALIIVALIVYLPGKIFEKKADEFYDELNKKENE